MVNSTYHGMSAEITIASEIYNPLFEPPIGHRHLPLSECAGEGTGETWWSETSAQQCRSGSIKANMGWRH